MEFSRRVFLAGAPAVVVGYLAQAQDNKGTAAGMASERVIEIPASYYQHFDADYARDVPEEGFGGWQKATLPFSYEHTALVVMHAWDAGTREQFPGWYRVVPYLPRSQEICRTVFPPLLEAARAVGLTVFHVVGGGDYYKEVPGYKHAVQLAGPTPAKPEQVRTDAALEKLQAYKQEHAYTGLHNAEDITRGFARLGFPPEAKPLATEGVAENGHQLAALCKEKGINHLVYIGFAINWCLLLSPGGMAEMANQYGAMCSTVRQATTAVENKESARMELCKQLALWRVSLAYGFVFDDADFIAAMKKGPKSL